MFDKDSKWNYQNVKMRKIEILGDIGVPDVLDGRELEEEKRREEKKKKKKKTKHAFLKHI